MKWRCNICHPNIILVSDPLAIKHMSPIIRKTISGKFKVGWPRDVIMHEFELIPHGQKGVGDGKYLNHNLPFFANVAPNHGFRETLMLLVGEATKTNTPNHALFENWTWLIYLSISWRLDLHNSIAFKIHLHSKLVLFVYGSTNPNPTYLFFVQHSFQLT